MKSEVEVVDGEVGRRLLIERDRRWRDVDGEGARRGGRVAGGVDGLDRKSVV